MPDALTWTRTPPLPARHEWYWWRADSESPPVVVLVAGGPHRWSCRHIHCSVGVAWPKLLHEMDGHWAGPLTPPADEIDADTDVPMTVGQMAAAFDRMAGAVGRPPRPVGPAAWGASPADVPPPGYGTDCCPRRAEYTGFGGGT